MSTPKNLSHGETKEIPKEDENQTKLSLVTTTSSTNKKRVPRIPAHVMILIAKFEGSLQFLVSIPQCQKSMYKILRNYSLNLSKQKLTCEQIHSCLKAKYYNIIGLNMKSLHIREKGKEFEMFRLVPNLQHLSIDTISWSNDNSNVDHLQFLKYLPKLEYISIKNTVITSTATQSTIYGYDYHHHNQNAAARSKGASDIKYFIHTPLIQHIDLGYGLVSGNIDVFQFCPALVSINFRESREIVGDIKHLQKCTNLESFSMLRTGVHGDTKVVRKYLHKLKKFDCQSTSIRGRTSDFRFCDHLNYLRYWGSNIRNLRTIPRHDNGTRYSDQYKGKAILQWLANWSKESDEVKQYEGGGE
jgi:hypothetical protein